LVFVLAVLYSHFIQFPPFDIPYNLYHRKNLVVKHREIGKRDVFTKNIMKKAQNDVDFIPSLMNHTISDAQKYFSHSSAAIKSSCWRTWGGGGRSAMKVSLG
jgi:hypothetical protein